MIWASRDVWCGPAVRAVRCWPGFFSWKVMDSSRPRLLGTVELLLLTIVLGGSREKLYTPPSPRHFQGRGVGVYVLRPPRSRNLISPPPLLLYTPHPSKGVFRSGGVGVYKIWPCKGFLLASGAFCLQVELYYLQMNFLVTVEICVSKHLNRL